MRDESLANGSLQRACGSAPASTDNSRAQSGDQTMIMQLLACFALVQSPAVTTTAEESQTIAAVNAYRAGQPIPLPPLSADPILMRMARERAPFYSHCPRQFGWCPDH